MANPHREHTAWRLAIRAPDDDVRNVHWAIPGYAPTPLHDLPMLAARLGTGAVLLKDEAKRFGLNAFKSLGATYAVYRELKYAWTKQFGRPFTPEMMTDGESVRRLGKFTVCAATAGNHGRALAWVARQCGLRAVIVVPARTAPARIDSIRAEGAEVIEIEGDYDAAVARAADESATNGWCVIADFGTPGYSAIPTWIESGYSTMFMEVVEQLEARGEPLPDIVVVQGGGGCFSAGAVRAIRRLWRQQPFVIVVEPLETPSFTASAMHPDGRLSVADGTHRTVCNGLNCPTPSMSSWPTLRAGVDVFAAVDDDAVESAMRTLGRPEGDDPRIVSGASGAAGLAGLTMLSSEDEFRPLREGLGLNETCRVLIVNTEGDTDPVHYRRIVGDADT